MSPNPNRLVIFKELKEIYGIPYSKVHVLRLEKDGRFPARITLSSRRVAWRAKEVAAWVEKQFGNRSA